MANSDHEVIIFYSVLKEALRCLSESKVSRIKIGTKRSNFYTGVWKGFTDRVPNCLLKKPDILGVDSYERNYDGEPSNVFVVCPL